jgi:hypothetical protein
MSRATIGRMPAPQLRRRDLRAARRIGNIAPPSARSWFVTDEAEQFYAEMRFRWDKLLEWGVSHKMPEERPAIEAWLAFSKAWEDGNEDPIGLNGLEPDLHRVEESARALGFVPRGSDRLGGRDPDELDERAEMHSETQRALEEARQAVEEATAKAKPAIPYALIALGVGALYLLTVGTAPLAQIIGAARR